jgi:hypothetical protein
MKYSKYFLNELAPEEREKGFGKMPSMVTFTDNDIIEGSHYFTAMVMGPRAIGRGHGPHTHNAPEVLVALGTDPDNPKELGAEIELCMGPELASISGRIKKGTLAGNGYNTSLRP